MNKELINNILIALSVLAVIVLGVYLVDTLHPTPKNITVIRWCADPNPMRKITIDGFEKKNPNIKVVNDPGADAQTILTQLAGNTPPEIMTAYDVETLRKFNKYGLLEDLTPYVKKYQLPMDKMYPELKDFVYCDNKIVGIPENLGALHLFYNKKLFDDAGIPYPTNDWTWKDLERVAKQLTTYKKVGNREVPLTKGLFVLDFPDLFVRMYGGHIYSPDGKKCVINSPESKKGMLYWEKLRMKEKVIPSASEAASMAPTGGWGGDQLLFAQGKVAMVITGRWMIISFRDYKDLRYGAVKLPKAPYPNNILFSKSYCIPKASKHKEKSILFLKNILSNDNQTLVTNYGDGWPVLNTPEVIKKALFNPAHPEDDNNKALMSDIDGAKPFEISPYISSVDYGQIQTLELSRVWVGEQTMDQACENIAKRINEIINRNLKNPNFIK